MKQIIEILLPGLILLGGCSDSRTSQIERLSESLIDVIALTHSHFEDLPQDERLVRTLHEYYTELHRVLDDFLESDPAVSVEIKTTAERLDKVATDSLRLYENLITEKRFKYSKAEEHKAKELQESSAQLLGELLELCEAFRGLE